MSVSSNCPICKDPVTGQDQGFDHWYKCGRCGHFIIPWALEDDLPRFFHGTPLAAPILSHSIRRMQVPDKWVQLDRKMVERILKEDRLPNIKQQADQLLLYLGRQLVTPDAMSNAAPSEICAIIGSADNNGARYVVQHLKSKELVHDVNWGTLSNARHLGHIGLTYDGWQEYEKLQRTVSESRTAFMAMKFENDVLAKIVADYLKPAVAQTGYELRRLDEGQKAGIIDNRMRAEIQSARFLVADLSDQNNGVYFEAGYAEGLGRPVFYTCEESVFTKRHFDTEHHLTVKWDARNPTKAASELKDAIRATLRSEAKLVDD